MGQHGGSQQSSSHQINHWVDSLTSNVSTCHRGTVNWTSYPSWHPLTQLVTFLPIQYDESTMSNESLPQEPLFTAAVCKFRKIGRDWFALPDFTQQVTRCLAFWHRLVPSTARKAVFFVGPPIPADRPYISQMVQLLRDALNVTVILNDQNWISAAQQRPDYIVARPLFHSVPMEEHPFQGYALTDSSQVAAIQQSVFSYIRIPLERNEDHPVVAILDSPRLGNVPYLRDGLQNVLSDQTLTILELSRNSSLTEFMRTLSQVDILVAPHGFDTHDILSQLLWMPRCGGLVEVFPPFYFAPQVHGSIAAVMEDFSYASIYTGVNVSVEWYEGALDDFSLLQRARKAVSCPEISVLAQTVGNMTRQWHACRKRQTESQRSPVVSDIEPFPLSTVNGCLAMGNPRVQLSNYPSERELEDLVHIVSDPSEQNAAVCVFVEFRGYWTHFPHAMEQLYRCYSFWQLHPHLKPYLVFEGYLPDSLTFVWSVRRDILGKMFGVQELHNRSDIPVNSLVAEPYRYSGWYDHPHQGIQFGGLQHADRWRKTVQTNWNLTTAGCQPGKSSPAIAILDRQPQSQRRIINVNLLKKAMSTLTDRPVQVHYFEKATFREQVEIMSNVDILISGHGAQLTSLHYMPTCGGVLEFFPPGYYTPGFFGPLAATSGLHHGFIYTGANRTAEWDESGIHMLGLRSAARALDICVPLKVTLESVKELILKWKQCCQRQS
eukprot:scaffold7213_cov166-Amphora_coffeaeformis.AAC.13